jgi:hypothetical protein
MIEPGSRSRAFVFKNGAAAVDMRDKKDNATFDLPGFELATPSALLPIQVKRSAAARPRKASLKQEQLPLLDETDASGLPVWRRDEQFDLTGLPVWAAN